MELTIYKSGSGSDGSDSGDGYGDGDGYGYGDGYGDGYGYGDGFGSGNLDDHYLTALLNSVPVETGVVPAFWRSNMHGFPANGGTGHQRKVGMVEEISGVFQPCTKTALHGTHNPKAWKGERWWIVGLYQPVAVDANKLASAKRIILRDLGKCPLD